MLIIYGVIYKNFFDKGRKSIGFTSFEKVMVGFQPLGRLAWMDGWMEVLNKRTKSWFLAPLSALDERGVSFKKYSIIGLARLSNQLGSSSGIH